MAVTRREPGMGLPRCLLGQAGNCAVPELGGIGPTGPAGEQQHSTSGNLNDLNDSKCWWGLQLAALE